MYTQSTKIEETIQKNIFNFHIINQTGFNDVFMESIPDCNYCNCYRKLFISKVRKKENKLIFFYSVSILGYEKLLSQFRKFQQSFTTLYSFVLN